MITMRIGQFETNSSSVHVLVIVPTEEFEKWRKSSYGNIEDTLFMYCSSDYMEKLNFITGKEVIEKMKEDSYWSKKIDDDYYVCDYAVRCLYAYPYCGCGDVVTAEKDGYTAISYYCSE